MSFQLSPTNRSQIVSTGDRFVVAVAGDFRGGQLHVQFSIDGVFASQGNEGIHIFETAGLRSFESNGEDIKLLWVGEAGTVNVSVTNLSATGLAFTEILGLPTVSAAIYALGDTQMHYFSAGCRRVSLLVTGSDFRYALSNDLDLITDLGGGGHFILQNERIDIRLPEPPAGAYPAITVFGDGAMYISELE
jgi:hypothetical protein